MCVDWLEHVGAVQRHHCDSTEIRGEERQGDAESKRAEEVFAYAEKEGNREKHNDRDQHDGKHCESHFVCPMNGGSSRRLTDFDVPVHVFEDYYGIVNQPREGQRQSA